VTRFSVSAVLLASLISLVPAHKAFSSPLKAGKEAYEAGDYNAALTSFTEGFRTGDGASGYYMARMLELGLGIEADKAAAVRLYQQTAADGYVASLNRVALMHYTGEEGLTQDYTKAAEYFEAAAQQGDANALFNLGKLYFRGQGVEANPGKALEYYRKAADLDHILALNTLGGLYRSGAQTGADAKLAREYFARSAAFGNAVGLYETAEFILQESTDAEHQIEAHMHLNLASARAHPNAPEALAELTALMALEDIERAQERARQFVALEADHSE
jgi:TPR repeat protein